VFDLRFFSIVIVFCAAVCASESEKGEREIVSSVHFFFLLLSFSYIDLSFEVVDQSNDGFQFLVECIELCVSLQRFLTSLFRRGATKKKKKEEKKKKGKSVT
jgi:hypothetical protein